MNEILEFIRDNFEAVMGLLAISTSLAFMGRQRAKQLVVKFLDNAKEDFLLNIDKHAPVYSKYIYAKLPKSARLFLTRKRIEKLIIKFAKEVKEFDLDNK
jgi:hypothetical protein